ETADYLPEVADLANQRATIYDQGCVQNLGNGPGLDEIEVCEDQNKPDNPTATVVISGGSHSVHWYAAIQALAAEYNWELQPVNKHAILLYNTDNPNTQPSNERNNNDIEGLETRDVDLVIANGTRIFADSPEGIHEGAQQRWQQITDTGAELVLMRGTPRPG